jgi:hypothetical protein
MSDRGEPPVLSQQLLISVAEELKMPLMQIARLSEQNRLSNQDVYKTNQIIQTSAESALRLIDNYVLGVRLTIEPQQLDVESVSVSSVLYDAGQQLNALAKSYGVGLELSIGGKFAPVLANRHGLQAALTSLGAALIEAVPALEGPEQLKLQLATHRTRYGVVAGVYAQNRQLSERSLRLGRQLLPKTRQPLVNLSHGSGAGVFIADAILKAMDLNLVASRHHRLYGLGTVLKSNNQLQLVS